MGHPARKMSLVQATMLVAGNMIGTGVFLLAVNLAPVGGIGFQTNYIYWFGNWIGNIAIAVAAIGYLAELIPGISAPPASVFATAAVIWILTFANIMGPRVVGALETSTMSLALIPILGIAFLGWIWFNPETFRTGWNVSGGSSAHAITRAASIALWAYMGVESAAVSAGVIDSVRLCVGGGRQSHFSIAGSRPERSRRTSGSRSGR